MPIKQRASWTLAQRGEIEKRLVGAGWQCMWNHNEKIDGTEYMRYNVLVTHRAPINIENATKVFSDGECAFEPSLSKDILTDKKMVLYFREKSRDESPDLRVPNRYNESL